MKASNLVRCLHLGKVKKLDHPHLQKILLGIIITAAAVIIGGRQPDLFLKLDYINKGTFQELLMTMLKTRLFLNMSIN